MYYHVVVERELKRSEAIGPLYTKRNIRSLEELEEYFVFPYLKNEEFHVDGFIAQKSKLIRFSIRSTKDDFKTIEDKANSQRSAGRLSSVVSFDILHNDKYSTDVTNQILNNAKEKLESEVQPKNEPSKNLDSSKVFIVHGHDEEAKTKVARFVEKLGFTAVILHEQSSSGQTIIEKIESNTDVGFAIVLYTECDLGKAKNAEDFKPRARQNVVFEHGFLIGKLSRKKVAALVKGNVETPSDIGGVIYTSMDDGGAWCFQVAKEMKSAGYTIDMNKLV